ncbi:PspA-associated protein PspAB [Patulibacter sp. S7RM1-6]
MGFLDALFGRTKTVKQVRPDALFALTTAALDLETAQGIVTSGEAAIVFQPLATGDFTQIAADAEAVLQGTGTETGTTVERRDDEFGYRWMVLRDPDVDDQVVGVNAVMESLGFGGYADRVLCAVFALRQRDGRPLHLVYLAKRGTWYPFVPEPGRAKERDRERELQLRAVLDPLVPLEPDLDRWYPLWGAPLGG